MYEGIEKLGPDVWRTTYYPKADGHKNVEKYIVDAADKRLGRLVSTIVIHVLGKNVPAFTPSIDVGAYVTVINAERIAVTGKKREQKIYRRHDRGDLRQLAKKNSRAHCRRRSTRHASQESGVLYKESEDPHVAQQPADERINMVLKLLGD